jgi:hypothetical protein
MAAISPMTSNRPGARRGHRPATGPRGMRQRFARSLLAAGAAGLLAAGVMGAPSAAAATGPTWSRAPIPAVKAPGGTLSAVSCPSSGACNAAGQYAPKIFFSGSPLAEGWDGTRWARQPMLSPARTSGLSIAGESCTSASACTVVGSVSPEYLPTPLVERWNGSQWVVQSVGIPRRALGAALDGISCWSARGCMAVGHYSVKGPAVFALAERWNGAKWSLQPPAAARDAGLAGVSCVSATGCVAVGSAHGRPLAESWDGTSWAIEQTPSGGSRLSAVSCMSAQACMAVGNTHNGVGIERSRALAESWNGTSWTILPTPRPGKAQLNAVSCSSAQACTAVGARSTGLLAERWNGTSWIIQLTGGPAGSGLNGVSCPSSGACTAVGTSAGATLGERWNGTSWTVQRTRNAAEVLPSFLNGVSCASASACTAVGQYADLSYRSRPLAERWNGTSWVIQPIPGFGHLNDVSCPSATRCVAVGGKGGHLVTGIWSGAGWVIQPIRDPAGTGSASLAAVSCPSPASCTAVGSYRRNGGRRHALAERWNGQVWKIQNLPAFSDSGSQALLGVSCASPSACIAVGDYVNRVTHTTLTVTAAWNGTAWALQATPSPPGPVAWLSGVSCTSPAACTAVGSYDTSSPRVARTLAERWDGRQWTIQPTANPSPPAFLASVSCPSVSACTAVGSQYDHTTSTFASLGEAFDGTAWLAQATPGPPPGGSARLAGVSCASASFCIAVGTAGQDLVEAHS